MMSQIFLVSCLKDTEEMVFSRLDQPLGKVAFITTAAHVYPEEVRSWIHQDKTILQARNIEFFEYDIVGKNESQIREELKNVDTIFVEGGNTCYLSEEVMKSNFRKIVQEKIHQGCVYIGVSAGAMIAAENVNFGKMYEDRENIESSQNYEGFGIVNFLIVPHWNRKDPAWKTEIIQLMHKHLETIYEESQPLLCLNDTQFVVVEDGKMEILENC